MGFLGCNHWWRLQDKQVLPSPAEQLMAHNITKIEFEGSEARREMFQKKAIYLFVCNRCGAKDIKTETLF